MMIAALPLLLLPLQDAPVPPMEALGRLCVGAHRVDGPTSETAYQRYDWGAGRRSILSRTCMRQGDRDRTLSQGIWFHDPAQGVYRVIGFATWGRVDGSMTIEGERWSQRYTLWRGALRQSMHDDWEWLAEDRGRYVAQRVEGEEQRPYQTAEFIRTPRPEAEPVLEIDPKTNPRELAPLAFLAGGAWEMDTTWPDGSRFHVIDEHRWGVGKLCLWKRTWRVEADGTRVATVDGVYFVDPDPTSDLLRFVMLADKGALYEGTVTPQERTLRFDYTSVEPERTMRLREVQVFEGDVMKTSLWLLEDEGERPLYADVEYRRLATEDE